MVFIPKFDAVDVGIMYPNICGNGNVNLIVAISHTISNTTDSFITVTIWCLNEYCQYDEWNIIVYFNN